MPIALSAKLAEALADPGTNKIIASVSPSGEPHSAVKNSLRLRKDGFLDYLEFLETSSANRNLTYALWFGKQVAISVSAPDKSSFLIKAKPCRAIISGREYIERYQELLLQDSQSDLGAVWILDPLEETSQDVSTRRKEEEAKHPLLRHLDRLAKR
jgi:hypothetical protein